MPTITAMDNFHDIYLHNMLQHRTEPEFINSPRSFKQRERLGTIFTLTNPLERVCYSAERRVNITFLYAEALWYLRGSNSLDEIAYYAPRMRDYSADGRTLTGTAYGPRIFDWEGTLNQWHAVSAELASDPASKRAVIHIRNPSEFAVHKNIDAACTLTLQFFNRDDRLHMFTNMRANDMYRGVLGDVFSFTLMMELMASELNLSLGHYTHIVASSHLYDSDARSIDRVLADAKGRETYPHAFPAMPLGQNSLHISVVQEYERALRLNETRYVRTDGELPAYWEQVVTLFEMKRQMAYDRAIDRATLEALCPLFHYFAQTLITTQCCGANDATA